ncbi:MAG: hypothetical protein EBR10_05340 [Planctomycetes bacterium]|nr:hypothetical protein [Planctomycetota bacterium]
MPPTSRPIEARDLSEIRAELQEHWSSNEIWSLGRRHLADALPGFVAEAAGAFAGLVTLHVDPGNWRCEVITLSSRGKSASTGAALLAAAQRHADMGFDPSGPTRGTG